MLAQTSGWWLLGPLTSCEAVTGPRAKVPQSVTEVGCRDWKGRGWASATHTSFPFLLFSSQKLLVLWPHQIYVPVQICVNGVDFSQKSVARRCGWTLLDEGYETLLASEKPAKASPVLLSYLSPALPHTHTHTHICTPVPREINRRPSSFFHILCYLRGAESMTTYLTETHLPVFIWQH